MGFFDFLFKNDGGIMQDPPAPAPVPAATPTLASSPAPEPTGDGGMLGGTMTISDVFSIKGRGTVATGRVQGEFRVGDKITIERQGDVELKSVISEIEAFRKHLDEAHDGDNVGMLLQGVEHKQVRRGNIIRKA